MFRCLFPKAGQVRTLTGLFVSGVPSLHPNYPFDIASGDRNTDQSQPYTNPIIIILITSNPHVL